MARNRSNNNTPTETVIEKAVAVEEKANVTTAIKTSDPAPIVGSKLAEGKTTTMRIYVKKRTAIYKAPAMIASNIIGYAAASSEYPVFLRCTTPSGVCYQIGSNTKKYIFKSADVTEKI